MDDSKDARIRQLEQRVDTLTIIVVVLFLGLIPVLPLIAMFAIGFLFLLPVLAFTHQYLPKLARKLGQLLRSATKLVMP